MQMSGWRRAVMSDNSELCLSWRGGSTMNSSYELWLCSFTDEANKGIKQSTSHTETHPYTESNVLAHYSESALRDTEADFLSTLSLSNLWENLHKRVNKHNQHNGIYTGHFRTGESFCSSNSFWRKFTLFVCALQEKGTISKRTTWWSVL